MATHGSPVNEQDAAQRGRLLARPSEPRAEPLGPGKHMLKPAADRGALLFVPRGYQPQRPAPLAVLLHGAGGNANHGVSLLLHLADEAGLLLLAPGSKHSTWDLIADDYGVDVGFIDQCLDHVFARLAVDRARLAAGGFSDGASYALSLGLINGDLFSHIVAFSPGFMAATERTGRPRIYVSHGVEDQVLPIDRCSRRIVPQLEKSGYEVVYREFDGPHMIPPDISGEAVRWLIN